MGVPIAKIVSFIGDGHNKKRVLKKLSRKPKMPLRLRISNLYTALNVENPIQKVKDRICVSADIYLVDRKTNRILRF